MKLLIPLDVALLYVKTFDPEPLDTRSGSIASIFNSARLMKPCLLVLEDIDSMVSREVRTYFLNEMDGVSPNDGIFIIGSANKLSDLDSAIANRPSRFDRKFSFPPPDQTSRTLYIQHWRQKFLEYNYDFPEELCGLIVQR